VGWLVGASGEGPDPKRARTAEGEADGEGADSATPTPSCCPYLELVSRGQADTRLSLDGGEVLLPASRDHLSRGSEFFRAMLGGGYLESGQAVVSLGGVGATEAEILLHHLHGCRAEAGCAQLAGLEEGGGESEEGAQLEDSSLGRALAAAGQFLLDQLTPGLERAAYRRCPPDRLPALFRYARRHHLPGLSARCLRGLLSPPPATDPRERARAWRGLAGGDPVERRELLPALRALLLEHV